MELKMSRRSFLVASASLLVAPKAWAQSDEVYDHKLANLRRYLVRELRINPAVLASGRKSSVRSYQRVARSISSYGSRSHRSWVSRTRNRLCVSIGHRHQLFVPGIEGDPDYGGLSTLAKQRLTDLDTRYQQMDVGLDVNPSDDDSSSYWRPGDQSGVGDADSPVEQSDDTDLVKQNIAVLAADREFRCGCIENALDILNVGASMFIDDDGNAAREYLSAIQELGVPPAALGYVEILSDTDGPDLYFDGKPTGATVPCGVIVTPAVHNLMIVERRPEGVFYYTVSELACWGGTATVTLAHPEDKPEFSIESPYGPATPAVSFIPA